MNDGFEQEFEKYWARRRFWLIVTGIPICLANLAFSFVIGGALTVMTAMMGTFIALRLVELFRDWRDEKIANLPDRTR